ncbi:hypothetical protein DsansV1_C13g0125451 [Dioscorea sansibarensis]
MHCFLLKKKKKGARGFSNFSRSRPPLGGVEEMNPWRIVEAMMTEKTRRRRMSEKMRI